MTETLILMKSELVITLIIFILLFIKIGAGMANKNLLLLIQWLLLGNLLASFLYNEEGWLFAGMYHTGNLIAVQKSILSGAVYLIALLFTSWFKTTKHLAEFFILLLSALLGMFFLLSAGNLLMFFLGLELATIPVAALANFDIDKKRSSEAAMKMILSSVFSSGILLFGISLVYGTTGTLQLNELYQMMDGSDLQKLSFIFLIAAFGFKLSIVPFHLWTADVYEGAPTATTSFLSVVSKGAFAFVLLAVLYKVFAPMQQVWYSMIVALSAITMLTGNLFAVRQQNIKRFLAFSSIAQVGFILVGISNGSAAGISAVVFFILVYVFSNLAAFAVADAIAVQTGREKIEDYKNLYQTNPFLSWAMALALFSLAGIPPAAGFFGKLFLISAGAAEGSYLFIAFAALNMVIALYYYLRVVRCIFMDKQEMPVEKIAVPATTTFGLWICIAGIVLAGVLSWMFDFIVSISIL
ncbi:MAG TPA: NADH-quinone oxidoreductase subunit N [Ferruginibacter sp.]|nr:NADH-quinone oxidoreductase subunit N [Ferruginibacter sp.]HMP22279.1 NADH-quinone oxidoreductase subunit N [Ferruginibacter sp.]